MKILVLNGPNINFIGIREKNIYGEKNYKFLVKKIQDHAKKLKVKAKIIQSNHEGFLIDLIQKCYFKKYDAIIINPGAYTHYSIALLDALKSVSPIRIIEVHLSDIFNREIYRNKSLISEVSEKVFFGKGIDSYLEAIDYLLIK
ncbi:MAG: type II 3-dehydroquinate dehydratase [Bacilli bacterium]|jgi:3-dehydroquinate dehydratase-2|nr:3-dehydroquinate dehydratase [Bacilli bacterium]MDD3121258.1 3-dehydroquinate dehydratase [Bacilli bacterium]MDD4062900.1 3-dehydroquinate dehydratase [Bacilli bacterium]MDD5182731.1 3-dehydroquinate dehydratase [Bacilli bacterium]MDY0363426.1 type II 3-dehydroquinate dehydratase [Bacilli bacterium]